MHQYPKVAIVILNWNGQSYLQQFLPSVLASTYPNLSVVVADNASADGSVQLVQQQFPSVQILTSKENYGFAKGYNYFLQQIQADYYVLLNSDVEVEPRWIEPVIELMEADGQIAACQPKIRSFHNRADFEYAGASGGWIDALGYPFSRGRLFDALEEDRGQYNDAAPIFWASGAAMFVRAAVFHELGGFDEYFFAHQEEIDLCWRMQRKGYKIFVCPQSVVYHVGGGTLPTGSERKVFLNFRNNLAMLTKNLPWRDRLWKIPLRLALDGVSAWKQLASGQPVYWKAVVKAHFAYVGWLFSNRKSFKADYPRLTGWYKGSIVWDYFVKGKKQFSQIVDTK
ncbi:MAG: glycosyltransferase family 2 protein [Chitinophagaceae bacterium]